jgi:hypothetical protein
MTFFAAGVDKQVLNFVGKNLTWQSTVYTVEAGNEWTEWVSCYQKK